MPFPFSNCRYCTAYSMSMMPPALYFTLTSPGFTSSLHLPLTQVKRILPVPGLAAICKAVAMCLHDGPGSRLRHTIAVG